MVNGTETIADDELLYRRVPESTGWYDPATGVLDSRTFAPHKTNDATGLSVSRAKYKSIEEAAKGRLAGASPISYTIKSIVADKPDFLALSDGDDLPDDWRTYPAYRANVGIEFRSEAGTPLEKVATYTITWNKPKDEWYITERF